MKTGQTNWPTDRGACLGGKTSARCRGYEASVARPRGAGSEPPPAMSLAGCELVKPGRSAAGGKRAESGAHERIRRAGDSPPV